MTALFDVTVRVVTALEAIGVTYSVGGPLASSISGEPRASIDADIVVDMTMNGIARFIEALGGDFYADRSAIERAVAARTTVNLIHRPTGVKIDLFMAGTPLEKLQLERRRSVLVPSSPPRTLYVHTAEDILLQKLAWFRQGGEVSDRQWRDALGVVAVQGPRLDRDYLRRTAPVAGVADLLTRAFDEADRSSLP